MEIFFIAEIFCKRVFLFQVEIEKNITKICSAKEFVLCTTDQTTPNQVTIPLSKLPWFILSKGLI